MQAHARVLSLYRSARLFDEDREPDDALALARQAVQLIPQIRPRKRERHAFELAMAFESFAERLRDAGDLEDAVAAWQESIAIREELIAPRDPRELPMIGGARWEVADIQLALGRNQDAIATAQLALGDWDRARDTIHWILGLGYSYSVLSRCLAAAERWNESLAAADEAIAIFRSNGGGPDLDEALGLRAAALDAT